MQLARGEAGRPVLALITAVPLLWLLAVTGTAAVQKVFHPSPRIGFLAAVRTQEEKLATLKEAARNEPAQAHVAKKALRDSRMIAFNSRIDATVTILFLLLVGLVVILAAREWLLLLSRRKPPNLHETDPKWLPLGVGSAPSPLGALGAVALGMTLLKELSGQAAIEREEAITATCECQRNQPLRGRQNAYLSAVSHRFSGVTRCC